MSSTDIDSIAYRLAVAEANINALQPPDPEVVEPTSKVSSLPVSSSTSSGFAPILLAAKTIVFSTVAAVAWTTYDASAIIPAGATYAWCELEYFITQPDVGVVDAYVWGRSTSGELELMLARGCASGTADNNADCKQVMIPITSDRKFDYEILLGFDGNCELRIFGYWK